MAAIDIDFRNRLAPSDVIGALRTLQRRGAAGYAYHWLCKNPSAMAGDVAWNL